MVSVGAIGFQLSVYCIGHSRDWANNLESRVENILENLINEVPEGGAAGTDYGCYKGFYYHFLVANTGKRKDDNVELSLYDTMLLMYGVLTAKEYFPNNQNIQDYADFLFDRVEWDWMVEAIGKHIEYYNNRKKKSLQNFSPQEAYLQMVDITKKLTSEELKYKALWTEEKTTRSGYIKLFDDILYRHAAFTVMNKVKIGYNVNDLSKVRVFGADGREMSTPAVMVQKGSYMQDEISAEAIRANKTFKNKATVETHGGIISKDARKPLFGGGDSGYPAGTQQG